MIKPRTVAEFALSALITAAFFACESVSSDGPLPRITVQLGGSIKKTAFEGIADAERASFFLFGNYLKPNKMTIALPDKRQVQVAFRSASVVADREDRDTVVTIYARRPLEPCRFQEAVADMLKTVRQMGAEPNPEMLAMPSRGNVPGYGDPGITFPASINAKAVMLAKDGTQVHCTLTPDPTRGWFVLYVFSVGDEHSPTARRNREIETLRVEVLKSGQTGVPVANQIEELFPVSGHLIDNVEDKPDRPRPKWITDAFFGDRYQLTMEVEVAIDRQQRKITRVVSKPTFVLKEIAAVVPRADTGWWRAEPSWRSEHKFGPDEWAKVYEAKGDFSVIGITIDATPVANAADWVRVRKRDRVPLNFRESKRAGSDVRTP